jgi:hypothetical protein
VVGEKLHAENIVELADAVELDALVVIDIQPLLLSHCKQSLTVEPPSGHIKLQIRMSQWEEESMPKTECK